jgi:hypothetical protein
MPKDEIPQNKVNTRATSNKTGFAFLLILPVIFAAVALGFVTITMVAFKFGEISTFSNLSGGGGSTVSVSPGADVCKNNPSAYNCSAPTIASVNGANNPVGTGYAGVPLFLQNIDPYASYFKNWGCAITSVAMVLRYYNVPVDPLVVYKSKNAMSGEMLLFSNIATDFNMNYRQDNGKNGNLAHFMPDIIASLQKHQPVVVGAEGSKNGPFWPSWHFVVFDYYQPASSTDTNILDGTIFVNNPDSRISHQGRVTSFPVKYLEATTKTFKHADFYTPKTSTSS